MQKFSGRFFQYLIIMFSFYMFSCMPPAKETSQELNIPVVKIHLKTVSGTDTIKFNDTYFLNTEEARYEFGKSNDKVFISLVKDGYKVYNDNRLFLFRKTDKISFIPQNAAATFTINNNSYQGELRLKTADSLLYLINDIDLESYLKGVVPAEIFTDNDTLMEAVKAQAICARSYSLKKMDVNKDKPFHMYSDVRDQVYRGSTIRNVLGDFAVDETRGNVLVYGKNIADIYFHASCGGILEAVENVWPGETKKYLSTTQDVIGKQFADMESPYFRWVQRRTPGQLDSLYNYSFGISHLTDEVQDTMDVPFILKVSERYKSGRIKKMSVQYGTDRRELNGYEIRRFFGWPPGTLLPSTLIKFKGNKSVLAIQGAGNGHGVGFCQYGAMYKAQKGLQYYHILQSYFPGTTLKKLY
jgi:stage II sporulation protein D (peptidoglycan lytic transglycosylase)